MLFQPDKQRRARKGEGKKERRKKEKKERKKQGRIPLNNNGSRGSDKGTGRGTEGAVLISPQFSVGIAMAPSAWRRKRRREREESVGRGQRGRAE